MGLNLKNWQKLLAHLEQFEETEHRKFCMSAFIDLISGPARKSVTVAQLRKNGARCGSAACLYGEAVIALGHPRKKFSFLREADYISEAVDPNEITSYVNNLLGIDPCDSGFIYRGRWACRPGGYEMNLFDIKLCHAIAYVKKVIAAGNVKQYVEVPYPCSPMRRPSSEV
jgi:hypothetical protein